MDGFNAVSRGVYIADNLEFLRALNDACVDLVCIDPPFAKNETFGKKNNRAKDPLKPPLSRAEKDNELRLLAEWGIRNTRDAERAKIVWPETAYQDIWSWEKDIHEDWVESLDRDYPAIGKVIDATRYTHSEGTAAYVCFMAIRLIEIHRVLKPTGSLYLHCDHTANGYLRQLLDAIFGNGENGSPGFRNGIIWQRAITRKGNLTRGLANDADTIFRYSKSTEYTWNPNAVTIPYDLEDLDVKTQQKYNQRDKDGRLYQLTSIVAPMQDPSSRLTYEVMGVTRTWRWSKERMAQEIAAGKVIQTKAGNVPRQIRYLDEQKGKTINNIWTDIITLNSQETERTGYPTQKPVALAERIIAASSNVGDVVLDCFAGCAYSAIAAEKLGRRWVACDLNPRAWTVFKRQFNKPSLALLTCDDQTSGQQVMADNPVVTIHGPGQLPVRTSLVREDAPKAFQLPERKFKVPASIIPEAEMLVELLKLSDYKAWCCGFANRRPDGTIVETTRNFHLDHIAPKSRENTGTSNNIQNRAPLCPYHNIRKNNRRVGLAEYRQEIADAGELMVNTLGDLINLDWAQEQAMQIYGRAFARRNPPGG